jgi:hypothetical protein
MQAISTLNLGAVGHSALRPSSHQLLQAVSSILVMLRMTMRRYRLLAIVIRGRTY